MNEITAKRLAVIRHLFEKGKTLSYECEPMNGLCLLPFHDSVEMFMKLCADEKGIQIPRNTMFMDYFTKIPALQDKAQMDSLNSRRVSLKHHGQMPSSMDVELTRANVIDFYEHNTPIFFGCKLEDVSLEVLISYSSVKEYIQKYHEFMDVAEYTHAQAQCQIAFREFMNEYHRHYDRNFDLKAGPATRLDGLRKPYLEEKTDKYLETLKESIYELNEAIYVMSLGINYFRYNEFVAMGPSIYRSHSNPEKKYDYFVFMKELYTEETARACYNFVMESILSLQGKNVFLY